MIEKLTHAPIVVSNQEKALKFYTDVLGFEKRADYQNPGQPRWLTVAPKGQDLEFILVEGKSRVDLHLPPEAGSGGYHLAFLTDDCWKDYERLKSRGVDFRVGTYTEPQKAAFGISALFRDPDGNQFALIQPVNIESGEMANSIGKATHVPILVRDQDKALKFYTEILGLEKRQDYQPPGRPRWLTVALKRQKLEFVLVKGEYRLDPRPLPEADSGGNHWVFRTDDCRKDFETLKSRGVKFKNPAPVEASYGIAAYFTDHDGNHLTLLQPIPMPPQTLAQTQQR